MVGGVHWVALHSRTGQVGFELYDSRASGMSSRPVVQCPGDCAALVPPGSYVLVASPPRGQRIGRRTFDLPHAARIDVEPANESTRWTGIGLLTLGIPLTLGGIGLAGGASEISSYDRPRTELFWLGMGGAAAGMASAFAGVALLGGKPAVHVAPQATPDASTANARYDAPPPGARDETTRALPPTATGYYRTEERPNQALLLTGAILFASSYGIGLTVAAVEAGGQRNDYRTSEDERLAVPFIGPFLGNQRNDNSLQILLGVPQLVGAGLFLLGVASPTQVRVREVRGGGVSVLPLVAPGLLGMSAGGSL